jgi:hypothetical protein
MRSHAVATMRALGILAFCAALTAGFLAHVWSAPQPRDAGAAPQTAIAQRAW